MRLVVPLVLRTRIRLVVPLVLPLTLDKNGPSGALGIVTLDKNGPSGALGIVSGAL